LSESTKYVTVSIPRGIAKDIDGLIQELGYWPSKSSFVREACLEKIWSERKKLRELREDKKRTENPKQEG
jgi:Arc/MetJ-type ribon-helix-helix transcriptional regulator